MAWRVGLSHFVVLLFITLIASADETATADQTGSSAPNDPEVVRLHLMDGSMIAGKLSVKELEVETKFGTLKVPITSIRSFTPGLSSHPDLGKQVYGLIDSLGSANYDERESAQKELVKMGESIRPELQKRVDDSDKERRERVRAILATLDGLLDEDEGETRSAWLVAHDSVETTEFTAVGKIVTPQFVVTSNYGPLTVKLSDVRRAERSVDKKEVFAKKLRIDGSNLVQRELKDVGIRVLKGDKIVITAEGSLTMTPWGRNAVSNPDGAANYGWLVQGQIPGGMLVATIGNNTQYIKVGSNLTLQAPKTGNLKLGVAMQPDHSTQQFPGGYDVKIVVERK